MGTNYEYDKVFTDYVHNNIAVDSIYKRLNWKPQGMNRTLSKNVDMQNAVDYFLIDQTDSRIITTQERFREMKFLNYNDITIRYEREFNQHEDRRLSEYYKLNADYFVYGVINAAKADMQRESENFTKFVEYDFLKYVVIDIKKLKELIDNGNIYIDRNYTLKRCKAVNGKICCPVINNYDDSSSFVPIDIVMLKNLFPDVDSIVASKNYVF